MKIRKLSRQDAPRTWLLRNLTASVILYERVQTTEARAKAVRRWVDRAINLGKSDRLSDRRRLFAWLPDSMAAKKIREVLAPRYADRTSGYTRLMRLGPRVGDGAMTFLVEFLPGKEKPAIGDRRAAAGSSTAADEPVEIKPVRRGLAKLRKPKARVTIRKRKETKS